ncbi:MAG: DNA-binding response regulator [Bdellovibrionales bacterium GWA2_49_15]|nr:MAG: DNA-binding response regulator [Bdellovibrionales bacterium GWA2_49_15]HAZ14910.1 DNA-binding response regulator [Bdellovibrionales bacterium]
MDRASDTQLILIVEDEKDHAEGLAYQLALEGYQTRVAFNGRSGVELALQNPVPDLVLLDLMLPDMMGIDVCREIRRHAKTRSMRVLILTARSEENDRVLGFEIGCDDYVTKPYSSRELMFRVKALLRRGQNEVLVGNSELVFGRLRMDTMEYRVWVDDTPVVLTALEFRLLQNFLERRGRVQSREVLLSDVWGIDAQITTRTIDTHMRRLREKLGSAGVYIETLRSVGYRFRATPDEATI